MYPYTRPLTGKHYDWDFIKGGEAILIETPGQMMVTDTGGLLAACQSRQTAGMLSRPAVSA